jgi:citrate lyase subunit beta/citryl-CoA lyase
LLSPIVPRRSALYLPASNARAIEKVRNLSVDVVIFDLEDAVSMESKEVARRQCCDAIRRGGFDSKELVIRVNGVGTPWHDADVAAALAAAPHGVLLPKVSSPQDVKTLARQMDESAVHERTRIWCMLETPRGVLAAPQILESHPRLAVAVMGTSDLTQDLHARHTRQRLPLVTALGLCLLAARANDLAILDGVFLALDDEPGFKESCEQGKDLGFDGKTLIHPRQVAICNAVFSPSDEELSHAHEVIAAHAQARLQGSGVAVVSGRLVEDLHVTEARRVIALREALVPNGQG